MPCSLMLIIIITIFATTLEPLRIQRQAESALLIVTVRRNLISMSPLHVPHSAASSAGQRFLNPIKSPEKCDANVLCEQHLYQSLRAQILS
jgi:hypothetical protein